MAPPWNDSYCKFSYSTDVHPYCPIIIHFFSFVFSTIVSRFNFRYSASESVCWKVFRSVQTNATGYEECFFLTEEEYIQSNWRRRFINRRHRNHPNFCDFIKIWRSSGEYFSPFWFIRREEFRQIVSTLIHRKLKTSHLWGVLTITSS